MEFVADIIGVGVVIAVILLSRSIEAAAKIVAGAVNKQRPPEPTPILFYAWDQLYLFNPYTDVLWVSGDMGHTWQLLSELSGVLKRY